MAGEAFIWRRDWCEFTEDFDDETFGKLFRAVQRHANGEENAVDGLPAVARIAFRFITKAIDRDMENFEKKSRAGKSHRGNQYARTEPDGTDWNKMEQAEPEAEHVGTEWNTLEQNGTEWNTEKAVPKCSSNPNPIPNPNPIHNPIPNPKRDGGGAKPPTAQERAPAREEAPTDPPPAPPASPPPKNPPPEQYADVDAELRSLLPERVVKVLPKLYTKAKERGLTGRDMCEWAAWWGQYGWRSKGKQVVNFVSCLHQWANHKRQFTENDNGTSTAGGHHRHQANHGGFDSSRPISTQRGRGWNPDDPCNTGTPLPF